jgi:hypothetical protein
VAGELGSGSTGATGDERPGGGVMIGGSTGLEIGAGLTALTRPRTRTYRPYPAAGGK